MYCVVGSTHDLHTLRTWGHFFSHGTPVWPWPVISCFLSPSMAKKKRQSAAASSSASSPASGAAATVPSGEVLHLTPSACPPRVLLLHWETLRSLGVSLGEAVLASVAPSVPPAAKSGPPPPAAESGEGELEEVPSGGTPDHDSASPGGGGGGGGGGGSGGASNSGEHPLTVVIWAWASGSIGVGRFGASDETRAFLGRVAWVRPMASSVQKGIKGDGIQRFAYECPYASQVAQNPSPTSPDPPP